MIVHRLQIEGLLLIESDVFADERGYFLELFNEKRFTEMKLPAAFAQDNLSVSKKDVIRGLHFQDEPFAQGKLVRVIKGAVLDVAVDIRKDSPTFGKYEAVMLTEANNSVLWIPPGFAHGFAVFEEDTVFHYKCTTLYNKGAEVGIRYDDKDIAIDWKVKNPVVSAKDLELNSFNDYKKRLGMKTATL